MRWIGHMDVLHFVSNHSNCKGGTQTGEHKAIGLDQILQRQSEWGADEQRTWPMQSPLEQPGLASTVL